MTQTTPTRTPIAFIDKTGYVTPFNGRFDTTLSGWYIYGTDELQKALDQQRLLEDQRVISERQVVGTHYAIDDVAIEQAASSGGADNQDEEVPQWAKALFGVDNVVPYLNLANEQPSDTVVGQVVTPTTLHEDQQNVDLTPDEISALQGQAHDATSVVQQLLGSGSSLVDTPIGGRGATVKPSKTK